MKSLEEVLKELEDAEREFEKKCEAYGIDIGSKKKKKQETNSDQG